MIQIVDKQSQQTQLGLDAQESWFFTSIDSAIDAVCNQLGFGWLPETEIAPLLEAGTLRTISENEVSRVTPLYFVSGKTSRHDETIQALSRFLLLQTGYEE